MTDQPPIWLHEIALIQRATEWFERMWPFDPERADHDDARPFWPEAQGEVVCPHRVEVVHHDGYRIGWVENRDNQTVFVRDYAEENDR